MSILVLYEDRLNNRPRKSLGYMTLNEVYQQYIDAWDVYQQYVD